MRRAAFFGVCHSCVSAIASGSAIGFLRKIILLLFALEFIQNKPTPPYTYGLGKVGTASGSEHIQPDRTEQR